MAETVLADGWHVIAGDVPGDAVVDSTLSLSGGQSLYLPSTASASATVVSEWIDIDDSLSAGVAASAVRYYSLVAHVFADSNAANKDVWIGWETADETRANILSTTAVWNAPLPSASTWVPIGNVTSGIYGSGARWVRVKIYRPADFDFDLHVDSVQLQAAPPVFRGRRTAATAFGAVWTDVAVNVSGVRSQTSLTSSTYCTIAQPGFYVMTGDIAINDTVAAGDVFGLRLYWRSDAAAAYNQATQSIAIPTGGYNPGTAGADLGLSVCATDFLDGYNLGNAPGEVRLQAVQSAGSTVNYEGARLSVTRIMG